MSAHISEESHLGITSLDALKRAEGINTMPEEMPTSSDGVRMKMYGTRAIDDTTVSSDFTSTTQTKNAAENLGEAAPAGIIVVPADIAVSSDGTGPVPIAKRADGINTMPLDVATMSDGITMKLFGRGFFSNFKAPEAILPDPADHPSIQDEVAVSSDGTGPVPIVKRFNRMNAMSADVTTMSDSLMMKTYHRRQLDETQGTVNTLATEDTTDTAQLPSLGDVASIPADVAVSSDGSGPVAIERREDGVNTMPAEIATMSDGVTMKVFG